MIQARTLFKVNNRECSIRDGRRNAMRAGMPADSSSARPTCRGLGRASLE